MEILVTSLMFTLFLGAIFMSDDIRNARADVTETTIGTSPIMRIYAGTVPANEGASLGAATLLSEITLPSNWMADAAAGVKAKSGTWQDASADGTGTATFYRIFESTGATPKWQGTVSGTGGGGDMTVDNVSFVTGQQFTIVTFSWTEPH